MVDLFAEVGTALRAVMAFGRHHSTARRAYLAWNFLMTVWTFHDFAQLFLEVVTWKEVICCLTLVLLHFGHLKFFFSYSEIDTIRVNFLLHFSHLKS
jgi:hypothetical protein